VAEAFIEGHVQALALLRSQRCQTGANGRSAAGQHQQVRRLRFGAGKTVVGVLIKVVDAQ